MTQPLFAHFRMAAYTLAQEARITRLRDMAACNGENGVLRLRPKTLCRNLRMSPSKPERLRNLLLDMEADGILRELATDDRLWTLSFADFVMDTAAEVEPFALVMEAEEPGRARSDSREARRERAAAHRARQKNGHDVTAKTPIITDNVTAKVTDVTDLPRARVDSDRSDLIRSDSDLDSDQNRSSVHPIGSDQIDQTVPVTPPVTAKTPAVTAETQAKLATLRQKVASDSESWTEAELAEAQSRLLHTLESRKIVKPLNYLRTVLADIRRTGVQESMTMLAVVSAPSTSAKEALRPAGEPCQTGPGDIAAALRKNIDFDRPAGEYLTPEEEQARRELLREQARQQQREASG